MIHRIRLETLCGCSQIVDSTYEVRPYNIFYMPIMKDLRMSKVLDKDFQPESSTCERREFRMTGRNYSRNEFEVVWQFLEVHQD